MAYARGSSIRSAKAGRRVKLSPPARATVGVRRSVGDSLPSISRVRGTTMPTSGRRSTRSMRGTESASSSTSGLSTRISAASGAYRTA